MKDKKSEIEVAADLLKTKAIIRQLQQVSYSSKGMEQRFPEIEFATQSGMVEYIRRNLALKYDLEEVLKDFNKMYKKYGNS